MTASQFMTESMIDESSKTSAAQSSTPTDLSDDDHQHDEGGDDDDSRMSNSTNGHTVNAYHDRPMEAATASQ